MGLVNINTNTLGAVVTAGTLRPPYYSDLDTWHNGIDGITFAESINNLPARFLPRFGISNGVDDKVTIPNASWMNFGTGNLTVHTKIKFDSIATNQYISTRNVDGDNGCLMYWNQGQGRLYLQVYSVFGTNNYRWNISTTWTPTVGVFYDIFIIGGQVIGDTKIYINAASQTITNNTVNVYDFTLVKDMSLFNVTASFSTLGLITLEFYNRILTEQEIIDCFNGITPDTTGLLYLTHPTGQGDYEYDLVGTSHGTWSGTGPRYDYDINGSIYPNTNGYSLWQLAANPDIQVPFDINGQPLSLTAGVDIPTGYTHTRDIVAGGTKWNMEDSLVDMEYGSILQNDTNGIAYANQNEAYGLVFDGIVNVDDNIFISLISDAIGASGATNNYNINSDISGILQLRRKTTTLFVTALSYLTSNTNYRLLVWRNETLNQFITGAIGTFVVYIQGKSKAITNKTYTIPNLAEMELVDVSGGLGTNPITDNTYTTSNYIVNDLDAVDQVSKIKVNGKYISPYDFTVSTGAYSIIDGGNTSKSPELISSLVNSTTHPYETAIISGRNITSAINTVSNGSIYDNAMALDIAIGDRFRLTFDFVLNSGQSPSILLITNGDLISGSSSNIINPTTGSYDVILTATLAGAGKELIAWNSAAANWSMTNISLKKIVSANNIFDRSNTTRQTATSRASLFYDANHPFIYHINEIADPRIYETFFEAAYEYRIFSRIVLADNNDLIRYDEELNYGTQKTPSEILVINSYLKNYLMTIPEEIPLQL